MTFLDVLPASFFEWSGSVWPGTWVRDATWGFAVVETIHIMVLAVLLGTIVIFDLRLLGVVMTQRPAARLARDFAPWTFTSMALMVVSGVLLFMAEAVKLSESAPFFFKILFLALAMSVQLTMLRDATKLDAPEGVVSRKVAACLSLICWFGVAAAGRAVAFL